MQPAMGRRRKVSLGERIRQKRLSSLPPEAPPVGADVELTAEPLPLVVLKGSTRPGAPEPPIAPEGTAPGAAIPDDDGGAEGLAPPAGGPPRMTRAMAVTAGLVAMCGVAIGVMLGRARTDRARRAEAARVSAMATTAIAPPPRSRRRAGPRRRRRPRPRRRRSRR